MSNSVLVVVVVFIEMFLHYFPWRLIFGKELPRLLAYGLGVLGLMVPFTVWLLERSYQEIAIMLWAVLSAGGLAVGALYLFDWVIIQVWSRREAEQRERALLEQMNGKSQPA